MFLYEIIDDYKDVKTQNEKDEIINSFCSSIWASKNKRRTYTKSIHFHVPKDLLNTDIGQIFNSCSVMHYKHYKSVTKDKDWSSIIRQKVNNIYTIYFDKDVILNIDYINLLKTPKRLYYKWVSGDDMDIETVTTIINNTIDESTKMKKRLQMEKMSLPWNTYKQIIDGFFKKCFDNCMTIEEYEDNDTITTQLNFLTEDHFYVSYICKRLDGNIKDYQKYYYGLKYSSRKGYMRCKQCGNLIEKTGNKRMYCKNCKKNRDLDRYKKYNIKRNHK